MKILNFLTLLTTVFLLPIISQAQEAEQKAQAIYAQFTKGMTESCSYDPKISQTPYCAAPKNETYVHYMINCSTPNETTYEMECRRYTGPSACVEGINEAVKLVEEGGCQFYFFAVNGVTISPPFKPDSFLSTCTCGQAGS